MITHVFLRYADRGEFVERQKRNWSPRTTYHEHYGTSRERMVPLIAEEYRSDEGPVPVGMLLVYFSGAKGQSAIPEVYEYSIEMLEPRLVDCFD